MPQDQQHRHFCGCQHALPGSKGHCGFVPGRGSWATADCPMSALPLNQPGQAIRGAGGPGLINSALVTAQVERAIICMVHCRKILI